MSNINQLVIHLSFHYLFIHTRFALCSSFNPVKTNIFKSQVAESKLLGVYLALVLATIGKAIEYPKTNVKKNLRCTSKIKKALPKF